MRISDWSSDVCPSDLATLQSRSARRDMDNRNGPSETTQRTLLSDGPHRAVPRSACVVVIHGAGLGGRADIDTARVLVGRSQEADLCIAHKSVSREHCQIWRDGDEYRILDLGATNTTRVNDAPAAEAVLADSDNVTVGEIGGAH